MATDLTIILEDRPGTLAEVGEVLGKAGVNIEGMCGFPCEKRGVLHILVADAVTARQVLEESGLKVYGDREVLVLDIEDHPGSFGKVARKIADAGVNVDLAYVATETKLVLGVDDMEKAKSIL